MDMNRCQIAINKDAFHLGTGIRIEESPGQEIDDGATSFPDFRAVPAKIGSRIGLKGMLYVLSLLQHGRDLRDDRPIFARFRLAMSEPSPTGCPPSIRKPSRSSKET